MAVGGLVLAGWLLGFRFAASVMPDFTTMKPNTAACLVLAGLSLWLLRLRSNQGVAFNPAHRRFAQICAMLVAILGLLTLGEHLLNLNLGIDQMLLRDTLTDSRVPPGRMSIPAAFGLFTLGSSLLFLGTKGPHGAPAAQILALIGLVDAVLAFLGYVYGVHGLYAISHYTTMAVHTALVFVVLCLGALFARPDRGLISVITSEFSGGQMARLILPLALALPPFLGWLRLKGEHAGLFRGGSRVRAFCHGQYHHFFNPCLDRLQVAEYTHCRVDGERRPLPLPRRCDAADCLDGKTGRKSRLL